VQDCAIGDAARGWAQAGLKDGPAPWWARPKWRG